MIQKSKNNFIQIPFMDRVKLTSSDTLSNISDSSRSLKSSSYKFDNSSVIVDINRWNDYASFLCSSLGLTIKEDIHKIENIKFVEYDKLGTYDFHIEIRSGDICSTSFIKLYYMKLYDTTKLSVYFTRAKNEYKFNGDIVNKIEILDELRYGFQQYTDQIVESKYSKRPKDIEMITF